MKCLRSGYCCIHYDVIIVDNPELGPVETNLKHKPFGERCQHLEGKKPGHYSCAVHDMPWYLETPCGQFGQAEQHLDDPCRVGKYWLDGGLSEQWLTTKKKNHRL